MKRFILGSLTVSLFIAQPSFAAKGDKLSEVQQVIEFNYINIITNDLF